ncbi:MAG: hypothetical protein IPN57_04840 [Ignavibacteria bacterium]|nr:hypothetical protein [Ignavibacteria bacterium]
MNNSYRRPGFFGGFSLFPPIIKLLLLSNVVIYIIFNLILSGFQVGGMSFDLIVTKYFALNPLTSVMTRDQAGQLVELSFLSMADHYLHVSSRRFLSSAAEYVCAMDVRR